MKIGYARVSTEDQTLNLQLDALNAADCEKICRDVMSGAKAERPGLTQALDQLRAGDVLVVWRLDRLGRTLTNLIELMNDLEARGIGFQSLTESLNTTTAGGKLIFAIFGALAEFERELIRERTRAGLAAARARGRKGGHPRSTGLNTPQKVAMAKRLYADPKNTIEGICDTLHVSKATLYRYLKSSGVDTSDGKGKRIAERTKAQAVEAPSL